MKSGKISSVRRCSGRCLSPTRYHFGYFETIICSNVILYASFAHAKSHWLAILHRLPDSLAIYANCHPAMLAIWREIEDKCRHLHVSQMNINLMPDVAKCPEIHRTHRLKITGAGVAVVL